MRTFGIERERFIVNFDGKIVPAIGKLLPCVHQIAQQQKVSEKLFSYELFAGQLEDRTHPCQELQSLKKALMVNDTILLEAANNLGLSFDYHEFADEDKITAFEVNPFDSRHQNIWASLSHEKRVSASVVAAVHIHISVDNEDVVNFI